MGAMGHCGARTQCGGDHDGLRDLGIGRTCGACLAGVNLDAIGALRCVSHAEGDKFLIFYRHGAIRHGGGIECGESLHRTGGMLADGGEKLNVFHVIHGVPPDESSPSLDSVGALSSRLAQLWLVLPARLSRVNFVNARQCHRGLGQPMIRTATC